MRTFGYAMKTEQTYLHWIRYFIRFHRYRHPKEMGEEEVVQFLNHISAESNCSFGGERIARKAIVFMYNTILNKPLHCMDFTFTSKHYANTLVLDKIREQSAQYVCGAAH